MYIASVPVPLSNGDVSTSVSGANLSTKTFSSPGFVYDVIVFTNAKSSVLFTSTYTVSKSSSSCTPLYEVCGVFTLYVYI